MATWTIDTETHLIRPGRLAPPLVCLQAQCDNGEVEIILASDPRCRQVAAEALAAERIVGHNIAYDLAVLASQFPDLLPLVWTAYDESRVADTMLAAQLYDIAAGTFREQPYSLASIAKKFCEIDLDKGADSWRLRYAELADTPVHLWPVEATLYAREDVRATRACWLALTENVQGEIPTLAHQCRAYWALHLASCWGMRCDPAMVAVLRQEIIAGEAAHRKVLEEAKLLRPDGRRNDALVRARALEAGVTKRTEGGKVSINAEALQDVDDPLLAALEDHIGWGKLRSTYLPVVEQGCVEPIHARYSLVESGRTGCSKPNIQNLPRKGRVRECFVPRPGYVYVSADYSVAELVCLAQVLLTWVSAKRCRMAEALLSGQDLHLVTAASIMRRTYEETKQRYDAGDEHFVSARQLAKGLNFGIPGGLGPAKLARLLRGYGHIVTEEEAKRLRLHWLSLYPEMITYFEQVSAVTQGKGWKCQHPLTGFVRGKLTYCAGANHLFQHLAAFGAKTACYTVQRACFADSGPLSGSRLVAFVHDELILETPEEKAHEAAKELVELMCMEFNSVCRSVPIHAEAVCMRRWNKKAKPVYRDGRLIPWDDR